MNLKPWLLAALLPCSALAVAGSQGALSISSSSFTDGGVIALQQVGPDPACGAGEERTPATELGQPPRRHSVAGTDHVRSGRRQGYWRGPLDRLQHRPGPGWAEGRRRRADRARRDRGAQLAGHAQLPRPLSTRRRQPAPLRTDADRHRPAIGHPARRPGSQRLAATAARPRAGGAEPGRALWPLSLAVPEQLNTPIAFIH
ncbi:PEBP family protein [Pseudomonas putida S11]|nr:PEBP family protein [Pseudomonas putida S11]